MSRLRINIQVTRNERLDLMRLFIMMACVPKTDYSDINLSEMRKAYQALNYRLVVAP